VKEALAKSTFVTVVAWIFIALSSFGTIMSISQNIMIQIMLRGRDMSHAALALPPGAPPFVALIFANIQWFFLAVLLIMVLALVSSIGLLRRLNWARLCFIGLMALAIAWQILGLVIQLAVFSSMKALFSNVTAQGNPNVTVQGTLDMTMFIVVAIMSVLFALGLSTIFGWIIKKLLSAPITAEFREVRAK
jgi:hypothetical protein